jgi:tetratricopeptide (TPR) repeat protein
MTSGHVSGEEVSEVAYQTEERARLRRQKAELAIQLALQSRWEEAVAVNRGILSLYPSDIDAWNRLGKALAELGRYQEAREAYSKALELDSTNAIARKNLARLATLSEEAPAHPEPKQQLDPQLFIEETGKTGVTTLHRVDQEVLARMTAGDRLELRPQGNVLVADNTRGEYVGEVEPKLGLRLIKLMEGGNQYAAALASLADATGRVIIKEVYQHPSQAGRPSFPATTAEVIRPYIKESILKYGAEEDEGATEDAEEGGEEWEGETEAQEGDVRLHDYQQATEGDNVDEYEE